jgi:hypothetical protein
LSTKSTPITLQFLKLQRGRDVHTTADAARQRAVFSMEPKHSLNHISLVWNSLEMICHVNSLHYQYVSILFNLAKHIGRQTAFSRGNPARLQRAAKGASQSTSRCTN